MKRTGISSKWQGRSSESCRIGLAALAIAGIVAAGMFPAAAQTVPPPSAALSSVPLLSTVPDGEGFTVTLLEGAAAQRATSPKKDPPIAVKPNDEEAARRVASQTRVVRWDVVRQGGTAHVEMTTQSGAKGEIWMTPGGQVTRLPGTSEFAWSASVDDAGWSLPLDRYGWPFTFWIAPQHFVSETEIQGVPARYYHAKFSEVVEGVRNEWEDEAWIDASTRRPIVVRIGPLHYAFQYLQQAAQPLVMPDAVRALLNKEEKRNSRILAIPAKP